MDDGASWTRMQSITQENDLEAFLNTAQLAGTEFTAGMVFYFISSFGGKAEQCFTK